jgi:hypothetical protein
MSIGVLDELSDEVRECYLHAKDCAQKAAAQTDTAVQQSFLAAERHWLKLMQHPASRVRSYRD